MSESQIVSEGEVLPVNRVEVTPTFPFDLPEERKELLEHLKNGSTRKALSVCTTLGEPAIEIQIGNLLTKVADQATGIDPSPLANEPFNLLTSQAAYRVSPYWDDINERLRLVANQFHLSDNESVIGVILYGSAAKGFWQPGSDIDGKVVTVSRSPRDLAAAEDVREILHAQFPGEFDISIASFEDTQSKTIKMVGRDAWLFSGMFIGNTQHINKIQRDYLVSLRNNSRSTQEWSNIQRFTFQKETDISKLFDRWDERWQQKWGTSTLDTNQRVVLQLMVGLRRTPPSLAKLAV